MLMEIIRATEYLVLYYMPCMITITEQSMQGMQVHT
jgi:hypothetical protein